MKPSCFAAAIILHTVKKFSVWKPKFHYFHHKCVPLIPDVNQMDPLQGLLRYFIEIQFDIALTSYIYNHLET